MNFQNNPYGSSNAQSKRVVLADAVPLEKPLVIRIDPTALCNFKCEFCHQSIGYLSDGGNLSLSDYKRIIDNITQYFGTVKSIIFGIIGEPLVSPHFVKMVVYARESNAAHNLEFLTNGSGLNPIVSDALVAAGISRIRISVNGLSDADYLKHTGVKLNFDEYIDNIRYLYEHREQSRVYAKIINYMVKTDEQKKRFFEIFNPITDECGIQALVKGDYDVDFERIAGEGISFDRTMTQLEFHDVTACPMPFYELVVLANGNTIPCCTAAGSHCVLGNAIKDEFNDIWRASLRFQKQMLNGYTTLPACAKCTISNKICKYEEDNLDRRLPDIKKKYEQIN